MLAYYFRIASGSIAKNPLVSILMVLAIAVGIGACMTIVTVNYLMAKDPIPHKSDQLFAVQLDSWSPHEPANDDGSPPDQLTFIDAKALAESGTALRQTAMAQTALVLRPEDPEVKPFVLSGRATYSDFFAMFDVPFRYGAPWSQTDEQNLSQVVVLSQAANERIFGGGDSVGRSVNLGDSIYTVVGVMAFWQPMPRFYDVTTNPFDDVAEVFVPFPLHRALQLPRRGNTNCWKPVEDADADAIYRSECVWTQFWAELPDRQAQLDYMAYLDAYVEEQKRVGRFARPLNNRLHDVNSWLEEQNVVDENATLMLPVAIMFLAVCLLNTIGLLLAKFLGKAPEIGLRRALGASRAAIFTQYLIESAAIGILGGVLGLALTWLGLFSIERLFGQQVEHLASLDWVMTLTAVGLAIVASVVAGLYPTWRACNVQPAAQLKLQ